MPNAYFTITRPENDAFRGYLPGSKERAELKAELARQSGTNDKAGTALNMIRWMSPHSVKETFNPSEAIVYPYMSEK